MEDGQQDAAAGLSTYEWTGLSLEELESGGKASSCSDSALLVVYLTLSAQYESFVLPFIVLLAVPMAFWAH